MLNKKNLPRFVFLIVLLLIFSCHKDDQYPGGGSPAKAKKNLLKSWTLQQFTVNGVDSMSCIDHRYLEQGALAVEDRQVHGELFNRVHPYLSAGQPVILYDSWISLTDSQKMLSFDPVLGTHAFSSYPFTLATGQWEILELQKSEIKLRMHNFQNDKEYIMVWR